MKLQRKNRVRALAVGALAVSGALALTACGSDNTSGSGAAGSSAATANIKCGGKGKLLASGSTAQKNAMDVWVQNYSGACKDTQINYSGTGSGAGVTTFLQGQTAFAGSDSPLTPEQIKQSKSKSCKGGQAIDLPMVGGPIAVGYNIPGVKNLVLNADLLAKIFDSKITNWNDPAIKKLNPGAKLPNLKIQPFHRSDDSGTTDNFTKYLKATAASDWKYSGGKKWQGRGGQAAQGSANLAAQVKQTAGAISYYELSYATSTKTDTVKIDTGASAPVEATSGNASKMIADAKVAGTGNDLALDLDYNTKAAGAYPITLVTNEILCDKGNDPKTVAATKSFLNYVASKDGQSTLQANGYAPLPATIADKVRKTISTLS